jgi:hypothetical protein
VEVIGSNPIAPTIPIPMLLQLVARGSLSYAIKSQPDTSPTNHCLDSEAGFILSN